MKTKKNKQMKKLIFMSSFLLTGLYLKVILLAFMLMSFAFNGNSQNSDNATIKAKAYLIGEISVDNEQDLNFGDIGFTAPTTVEINNTNQRGRFFIDFGPGNPNANLTFELPDSLIHAGDGPALAVGGWKYDLGLGIDGPNQTELTENELSETTIPVNLAAGGDPRKRYVFVGATVTPQDTNWVGYYEGDVTLTVEYN